jgi:hypothetical protein
MANKRRTVGYDMVHGGVAGRWYYRETRLESKNLHLELLYQIKEVSSPRGRHAIGLIQFIGKGAAAFLDSIDANNLRATEAEVRRARQGCKSLSGYSCEDHAERD